MKKQLKIRLPHSKEKLGKDLNLKIAALISSIYEEVETNNQFIHPRSVYCSLSVLAACHDIVGLLLKNLGELIVETSDEQKPN